MRSHRQNCDVDDITSEQIKCEASRSRAEVRRQKFADRFCAFVALVAILAGWAIASAADNRADAAMASIYVGTPHGRIVNLDAPGEELAAPRSTCVIEGANQ